MSANFELTGSLSTLKTRDLSLTILLANLSQQRVFMNAQYSLRLILSLKGAL